MAASFRSSAVTTRRLATRLAGLLLLASTPAVAEEAPLVGGYPPEQALELGKQMYREGLLPSGEPMEAIVQGDIPLDGTMATCESCHLRSGLGTSEGTVITTPTSGPRLYRPRALGDAWKRAGSPERERFGKGLAWETLPDMLTGYDVRPAYTDATLATAMRMGRDPTGNKFNPIMPRYILDDAQMEILIYYLKNLSAEISPGVDQETLYLATVVTDEVPAPRREAMLQVLRSYVDDHNRQSRHQSKRARQGPFYRYEMQAAFRLFSLDVWTLSGPPETWPEQLAAYYEKQPVFALLGGISSLPWDPIHRFCEQRRLPCLFPVTRLPVIADDDWYTLYFSKGYYQEGETTARFLRLEEQLPRAGKVIQVVSPTPASRELARGFTATWLDSGHPAPVEVTVGSDRVMSETTLGEAPAGDDATLLLWLEPSQVSADQMRGLLARYAQVFVSWELWQDRVYQLEAAADGRLLVTYPYALPTTLKRKLVFVQNWLRIRGVPADHPIIQAKMYFVGWMLGAGLMDIREEFYRDYFLDAIDMMIDQTYSIAAYPRVSFGPGQRYASKGCYIAQVKPNPQPELVPLTEWVVY